MLNPPGPTLQDALKRLALAKLKHATLGAGSPAATALGGDLLKRVFKRAGPLVHVRDDTPAVAACCSI